MIKFGKAGKTDCPVCQTRVSNFGSFKAKPRKELNLKI
jgi:uncharacterized Zn finger protein (UPF0148 family)